MCVIDGKTALGRWESEQEPSRNPRYYVHYKIYKNTFSKLYCIVDPWLVNTILQNYSS